MSKNNIIKIVLNNKRVNNYTKLMIMLNTLDYFEDYYIPNKKLMNMLGTEKNKIRGLLHQLEEDEIIKVFYKKRKRYFTFIARVKEKEEQKEVENNNNHNNLFDYDWLNDDEGEI